MLIARSSSLKFGAEELWEGYVTPEFVFFSILLAVGLACLILVPIFNTIKDWLKGAIVWCWRRVHEERKP